MQSVVGDSFLYHDEWERVRNHLSQLIQVVCADEKSSDLVVLLRQKQKMIFLLTWAKNGKALSLPEMYVLNVTQVFSSGFLIF